MKKVTRKEQLKKAQAKFTKIGFSAKRSAEQSGGQAKRGAAFSGRESNPSCDCQAPSAEAALAVGGDERRPPQRPENDPAPQRGEWRGEGRAPQRGVTACPSRLQP